MIHIRPADETDFEFLELMAIDAMWWNEDPTKPALADARLNAEFKKLLEGWGRPGDQALTPMGRRS